MWIFGLTRKNGNPAVKLDEGFAVDDSMIEVATVSSSEMGRLPHWKNPTQEPAKIGEILHDNMDYSTILTIPQKRPYFPGIENVALGVVYTHRYLFITKPTGYNKLMLISITFTTVA